MEIFLDYGDVGFFIVWIASFSLDALAGLAVTLRGCGSALSTGRAAKIGSRHFKALRSPSLILSR